MAHNIIFVFAEFFLLLNRFLGKRMDCSFFLIYVENLLYLFMLFHVSFSILFEYSNLQLIPGALQVAFEEDREFHQGLPLNYLDYMGVANSESVSSHGKN